MRILGVLLLVAMALAQGNHRTENRALLGVVTAAVPDKSKRTKVVVRHVLRKSPAEKAAYWSEVNGYLRRRSFGPSVGGSKSRCVPS